MSGLAKGVRVQTFSSSGSGKNMTLDEVAAFVQTAMRIGHEGAAHVKAQITMGGQIKQLQVTSTPQPTP